MRAIHSGPNSRDMVIRDVVIRDIVIRDMVIRDVVMQHRATCLIARVESYF
jgi:hypothetical protein